jgi:hypothetical protein
MNMASGTLKAHANIFGNKPLDVVRYLVLFWKRPRLDKQAREKLTAFLEELNQQVKAGEGLQFDTQNYIGGEIAIALLGSQLIMAFDAPHRKLAVCDTRTGNYHTHDFSWVLKWNVTWDERTSVNRHPADSNTANVNTIRDNYTLEIQVADPQTPLIHIAMPDQARASAASARLNAFING